jgi:hypothetical protein
LYLVAVPLGAYLLVLLESSEIAFGVILSTRFAYDRRLNPNDRSICFKFIPNTQRSGPHTCYNKNDRSPKSIVAFAYRGVAQFG